LEKIVFGSQARWAAARDATTTGAVMELAE